jgi:hypothetical protein
LADAKISALTALTGANLATDDEFAVVDTSVTTTKKITVNELLTGLLGGTCTFDTTYALATAATFGWSTDLILRRAAAANLALGAANAASPVAQTISVQSVLAGTSDVAGATTTFIGSISTGTGLGGGFDFRSSQKAASTASTANGVYSLFKVAPDATFAGYDRTLLTVPSDSGMDVGSSGLFMWWTGGNRTQVMNGVAGTRYTRDARVQFTDSTTDALVGTSDTGVGRNAAGVLEVNNGTNGTYRDLRARNLRVEPTAVASLVAASTAGEGALAWVNNATATTPRSTVAGGGANKVLVMSDGTNWLIVA